MEKSMIATRDGKTQIVSTYDAAELTAQFYENREALQAIDGRIAELEAVMKKGTDETTAMIEQLKETKTSIEWFITQSAPILDSMKKKK